MRLARVLSIVLALWCAALVLAPVALASSRPAILVPSVLVYRAGAVVCHQQGARSFAIAGRQMPVCARCTGLYGSALLGAVAALLLGAAPQSTNANRIVLASAAVPTLATVILERGGFGHPSNLLRAVAAVPLGIAAAWVVIGLLQDIRHDRAEAGQPFGV